MAIELRVVQFWSEIILVISNRTRAASALVQFWNHAYDFRPNYTPLSSITIINIIFSYMLLAGFIEIYNLYISSILCYAGPLPLLIAVLWPKGSLCLKINYYKVSLLLKKSPKHTFFCQIWSYMNMTLWCLFVKCIESHQPAFLEISV